MDGSPSRGETIPIRLFLGGFDLTPTFREVNKKYSTRYYLSLVLIDEGTSHPPLLHRHDIDCVANDHDRRTPLLQTIRNRPLPASPRSRCCPAATTAIAASANHRSSWMRLVNVHFPSKFAYSMARCLGALFRGVLSWLFGD